MGIIDILTGLVFGDVRPGDSFVSDEGACIEITPVGVSMVYEGERRDFLYTGVANLGEHLFNEIE